MLNFIVSRVLGAIPVLLIVTMAIFGLLRLAPGDAADLLLPDDATDEQVEEMREAWGLDRPIWEQYGRFLGNLASFDLGESYRYRAPVFDLILDRLPATLELSFYALLVAILVSVPLGMIAALNKGKIIDALVSVFSISGVSAPSFWIGILLVLFLSGYMNLFPSSGRVPYGWPVPEVTGFVTLDALLAGAFDKFVEGLSYLALPALTLAFAMIGIISRITRSSVIDAGQEEHVFTAVAKGMTRRAIVRRHLMPNAAIPIITIIGLELGALISGSIIVEVVFSWPGIGTLLFQAISVRDMPLTTGIVASYTVFFILLNLMIDIVYTMFDPRLRSNKG